MTPKYHINLFWSEADGAWVADVPDLRSCSAFGDTPAEALAEVEKAMAASLAVARDDGLPIPQPRHKGKKQAAAGQIPQKDTQITAAFIEVRQKAHDLIAAINFYFLNKNINEIIFVPTAIFSRIIGTHDSVGLLLRNGDVVDAAVVILAQFELRVQLAWVAHDIKNASQWVAHGDRIGTPRKLINTIDQLYPSIRLPVRKKRDLNRYTPISRASSMEIRSCPSLFTMEGQPKGDFHYARE